MFKNNKGFSLIEVLVTVGLIGILVGIAVPQYGKYKARTGIVALKADMGNAQKSYTAYDAVNNTLCADWVAVGLADSATSTVFSQSQLYRKQAYIGFDGTSADCALSSPVLNYSTERPAAVDMDTQSECEALLGIWTSTTPPAGTCNISATNTFTGGVTKCVLGSDSFVLGATTGVANINEGDQNKGFFITNGGIVSASDGTDVCE